jgi:site-specific DNA recombinase
MSNSTTAIGYIRVSTSDQVDNGVSLDAQRSRIHAYCTMKGLDLLEIYHDNGVSAGKPLSTRVGGTAALEALSSGRACHIVTYKLDRLFRSALDCLACVQAWDKAGVSLHLIDMGGDSLDSSTPTGKCFLTVAAAFAELERGLISERTKAVARYQKAQHRAYSPTPLGYRREGDDLVDDPDELATVTRIKAWRDAGQSYGKIAATLNSEQAPTKQGGKWYPSTVRQIALNDLYAAVV